MTTAVAECVHHWVIETPAGPVSTGRCKNCDATRDFPSSSYRESDTAMLEETKRRAAPTISRRKNEQSEYVLSTAYVRPVREKAPKKVQAPRPKVVRVGKPVEPLKRVQTMTPLQSQVVAYVRAHGPVKATEISEALREDRAHTGDRLRGLVARGALDREMDADGAYIYRIATGESRNVPPPGASGDGNAVLIETGEEVINVSV